MDIYKYLAVLTQMKNLINKTKPIHLKKIMPDYQPSLQLTLAAKCLAFLSDTVLTSSIYPAIKKLKKLNIMN